MRYVLAAVISFAACFPALAQDLLATWAAALQRDPIYAAARAGRDADQEKIPQARAKLLPYITLDSAGEINDVRRTNFQHHETRGVGLWALTLTQPIVDVGTWSRLRQSEYIADSANLALQQAYQDLILRVSQAYFDVLAAQDTLSTIQAQKRAVETQLEAAERGFELGATTVTDIHEARSRLDLLNASEIEAQNALQISEDQLAKITGERPAELAGLDPETSLPPPAPARLDDWTAQSAQASLDVARARLDTLIAEKQIDIAKGGHYPTLSLYAQTGSASDRGINGQRNGPRSIDSAVGLQLSIPLFSGGEISSQVREQTSRLQQARYIYESAKRQAVQSTQQYFSGVISGLSRIEALRAAEKSSLASLEANRTGYELGVRVNIDVLNAQQQLYETRRALSRARYETLMNSLRLKAASGILSDEDIVAINSLLKVPTQLSQ
ncbi:MAG TPA: TolC family outer membrane protein [Pusillimonas sp.]|uniref:TolC family outer membrane protein n=1 Tax=unclassified Pusillimonas TaxID=2640016 RepID=UPI002632D16D|nr:MULTISPECIES: TolC family outer membrane protein [unclassified Pusillimonas]HLU18827.1 TolC family outer membrane protein [Pusillimonas sp.]